MLSEPLVRRECLADHLPGVNSGRLARLPIPPTLVDSDGTPWFNIETAKKIYAGAAVDPQFDGEFRFEWPPAGSESVSQLFSDPVPPSQADSLAKLNHGERILLRHLEKELDRARTIFARDPSENCRLGLRMAGEDLHEFKQKHKLVSEKERS